MSSFPVFTVIIFKDYKQVLFFEGTAYIYDWIIPECNLSLKEDMFLQTLEWFETEGNTVFKLLFSRAIWLSMT